MAEESKLAEKLENETKFSEEEMKEIKEIQESYLNTQNQLGALQVARLRFEEQVQGFEDAEKNLRQAFRDTQEKEKKFLDETTKKYGDGTLNPETGIFTPNKPE